MKFKPGDKVYIKGTIQRIEILPDDVIVYYCQEGPDMPFRERDLLHVSSASVTVEGLDSFTHKLEEFGAVIEKARSMYKDLAHFDMKLNLSFKDKGELVTTELVHIFADMNSD